MKARPTFNALVLEKDEPGVEPSIQQLPLDALPDGDVLVRVEYSSLNYKDGLAVTGRGKVVRTYPMVPGIDLAGTVVHSATPRFAIGDQVIATGWGLGERHWGGFAQMARVRSDWLVPLPRDLSLQESMGIGTAGLTAMLAIMALEKVGLEGGGDVVVTGAGGGLGSLAVAILANLGYRVVAASGRSEVREYLQSLGAADFVDRAALSSRSGRPLESARWAGAIDPVGGDTLAGLLPSMAERSSIAVCGNAGGAELTTSVYPFILRGVSLLGIESVRAPAEERGRAWDRLAHELPKQALRSLARVEPLHSVPVLSQKILEGQIRGRVIIDVNASD